MIGDLTSGFEMTWIRNTSEIDRLHHEYMAHLSERDLLEIRTEQAGDEDLALLIKDEECLWG